MRITIQTLAESIQGKEPCTETSGVAEHDADVAPASGLGSILCDARALLWQLQVVVLHEKGLQFVQRTSRYRR